MGDFILRLVGYGLLLGVASRLGQVQWTANGLDAYAQLVPLHDVGLLVLVIAPLPLALAGFGALRGACMFAGCFLAGAAITAPFAIARVAGAV